ncbi:MAG: TonB-dependent siderophore receptor [Burkholderiales bacterium]|nr:TonB-dependent siderophore receptor [Burkholderiales bacterium]
MASFFRSHSPSSRRHSVAAACAMLLTGMLAQAQSTPTETVNVTGRSASLPANVTGFGEEPLSRTPIQAVTLSLTSLQDAGTNTLGDITRMDASIGDAYNATGYWAGVRVRGFELSPRSNFRRDGLPINAETTLSLANKERVEVLKGTSGAQAGISSPGGLVNLQVKRPRGDSTTLSASLSERGGFGMAADIDRRLGVDGDTGLRLNVAAESLRPELRNANGQDLAVALAGMARLSATNLLEAELEINHQSQPSAAAFSLQGSTLPSARQTDPRLNLNNQPWAQPVVFDGNTASLRWTHMLNVQWRTVAQAMTQQLRTNDRMAFPYGCGNENVYDRYCSDGSLDLYDYRSEGERRNSTVLALRVEGQLQTGALTHQISAGVLNSDFSARFHPQAYNWAGVGSADGRTVVSAAPVAQSDSTSRDERSTELHVYDQIQAGDFGLWLGLRNTQLHRASASVLSGTANPAYDQGFTTPWGALTWQLNPQDMLYASAGQGVETYVTPNRTDYGAQAGQPLPAQRSRQVEVGLKHEGQQLGWSLTAFDIHRPYVNDTGTTYAVDGLQRHLGLEAGLDWRDGPWSVHASAMLLRARREGAASAADNGLVPTNVAQRSARAQLGYSPAAMPGLTVQGSVSFEGAREVLPDGSVQIPAWAVLGLSAKQIMRASGHDWTLRAGVDNLLDRRAWKESPYQYGHAYLYPLAPRTFRVSVQVGL